MKKYNGRRGSYLARTPYLKKCNVVPFDKIRDSVKKEYELLKLGDFNSLKEWKIWKDDESLLNDYCNLFRTLSDELFAWKSHPTSRNNVVVNKSTCIAWIQLFDDYLIVVQRSQDKIAKRWDKETISLVCHELDVKFFYWFEINEHKYLDKSKIARRPKIS